MAIKPRNDDPECCAALGRIPQTPDGPNWAEAAPGDALLAEKLIRYYWRFALNVAGKELKRHNSVPRAVKNRVQEYQEEYFDDDDPDDLGTRPGDESNLERLWPVPRRVRKRHSTVDPQGGGGIQPRSRLTLS